MANRTQFAVGTFNLFNLNRPGLEIYSDKDGWDAVSDVKVMGGKNDRDCRVLSFFDSRIATTVTDRLWQLAPLSFCEQRPACENFRHQPQQ